MSEKVYAGKKGSRASGDRASRSKISRRKPNRYSFEGDSENVSKLAKKMKSSISENDIEVDASFGYRIIKSNFLNVFMTLSEVLVWR